MSADRELVEQALAGDAVAFEALLARYRVQIRRHLLRYTHDDVAAQDLLQEAFLRVWTRGDQWDGRGTFRAWLYRVATNLALNHLRTVRRRRETPLETEEEVEMDEGDLVPAWMIDDTALGPQAALEQAEERQQVRRLVAALPDEKRAVFRLVHEMEMTIHDAAVQLEIPEGTVKSRLHYARKQLADDWQALDDT
ncbi:MAG TPA: RNA polymerase sigma factor [Anaerolineae bacterium]|nr:RNA polymerase sigma factor [Anaerolineae bacterium]